jgi:hypothetical protein
MIISVNMYSYMFIVVIIVIVIDVDMSVGGVGWVLLDRKNWYYIIVWVHKHNIMYKKVIDLIKVKILSFYIILKNEVQESYIRNKF